MRRTARSDRSSPDEIDTSAVVAILFQEPDQRRYDEAIEAAPVRLVWR
jgi:uncharacterized protein with PIN domain